MPTTPYFSAINKLGGSEQEIRPQISMAKAKTHKNMERSNKEKLNSNINIFHRQLWVRAMDS